jgi:hypothetical protein
MGDLFRLAISAGDYRLSSGRREIAAVQGSRQPPMRGTLAWIVGCVGIGTSRACNHYVSWYVLSDWGQQCDRRRAGGIVTSLGCGQLEFNSGEATWAAPPNEQRAP